MVKSFQFLSTAPHESSSVAHAVLERNGHGSFGLAYKIKNVGKRPAPKSTVIIVVNGHKVGQFPVGAIAPGKAITVRKTYNPKFGGPGKYKVYVCADYGDPKSRVREANERNNCTREVMFRAVPRRWNVATFTSGPNSLVGGAPFFASRADGVTFDFYGVVNDQGLYFLYLAKGGISGRVSGSDPACSYTGEGSVSHSPWDLIEPEIGYLEVSTDLDSYFAEIQDEGYSFTATQNCPGYPSLDSTHAIWPLETKGLDGRVDRSMTGTDTTLSGNYTIPTGFGTGSGVGAWSFKADL